jgi:hypothetical protein
VNTFNLVYSPSFTHDIENAFNTGGLYCLSGFLQPGHFAVSGRQWQSQVWQKCSVSPFHLNFFLITFYQIIYPAQVADGQRNTQGFLCVCICAERIFCEGFPDPHRKKGYFNMF